MATIGIREFQRNASKIIEQVQETGRPVLVTRHGRAAVALIAIRQDELEDFILSRAPEFAESMRQADEDLRDGRTRSASDVFAELLDE
jgi:prevent-host-death family protein